MTWKDKRITEINKLAKGNSDPETPLGEEVYAIYSSNHATYDEFYKDFLINKEINDAKQLENIYKMMKDNGWNQQ
jgi:hypothetical protein